MRTFAGRLALVAAAAFVLRTAFSLLVVPDLDPTFDPALFHHLGTNLAEGLGFVRPPHLNGGDASMYTAEFGPVTPAIVAVATVLGAEAPHVQGVALALVGGATVVATGALGREVAGERVGLVAAAIAAAHPLLVQVDAVLTAESPYLLLVTVALLLAVRAARDPAPLRFAALGASVGVAALARAEGVALVLLPLVAAVVSRGRHAWRPAAALAGAGVIAAVAVVAPWTVRNAVRFGAFVPISNNAGSVVLGANCPSAYAGQALGSWDFGCVAAFAGSHPSRRVMPGGKNEAEVYAGWRAEGLAYATAHAGDWPLVAAARIARTWGLYWDPAAELDRNVEEGRHRGWQAAGFAVHAFGVLPLAAIGLARSTRSSSRIRRWWIAILAVPLALAVVVPAMTVGQTRQRTVAESALAVLAAAGVAATGGTVGRSGRSGRVTQSSP